jgi:hypothetical protein
MIARVATEARRCDARWAPGEAVNRLPPFCQTPRGHATTERDPAQAVTVNQGARRCGRLIYPMEPEWASRTGTDGINHPSDETVARI